MKRLLFLLFLLPFIVNGQTVVTLSTADTSKIRRTTGTTNAELKVLNADRNVANGIAYNASLGWMRYATVGNGLTFGSNTFRVDSSIFANKTWVNGRLVSYAPISGSGNYIQNQTASPQTAGFNITGAATIGGAITSTLSTAGGAIFVNTSGTTNRQYLQFQNTGANFFLGNESSAGGSIFTGAPIYSTVLGTSSNTDLAFFTNGTLRQTIASTGGTTFTGTVTMPTPFTLGATSVTTTGTQLNYLSGATGTTGTASTNLVFSTSPVLTTPNIGAATFSTLTGGTASTITFANTGAGSVTDAISIRNGGTTAGTGNRISFITGASLQSAGINSVLTSATAGDLVFSAVTGSALFEGFRLTSGGDFGLGTSAPNVSGYAGRVLTIGDGTTAEESLEIYGTQSGSNGAFGNISFLNAAATGADKRAAFIGGLRSGDDNSGGLNFLTRNAGTLTSALTIDGSQNSTFAGTVTVPDDAYDSGWNGDLTVPTKNAIYDAIQSGTYTPTATGVSNVDSATGQICQYTRIGSIATVYGWCLIDPTATGSTVIRMTLPVASNFGNSGQANGVTTNTDSLAGGDGTLRSDATNDEVELTFIATSTSPSIQYFTFSYQIL